MQNEIDVAWKQLHSLSSNQSLPDDANQTAPSMSNYTHCSECGSKNLREDDCDLVCTNCGLVAKENIDFIDTYYDTSGKVLYYNNNHQDFSNTPWKHTKPNDKIKKMNEWMMWTNAERIEYKLKLHVTEICYKLNIDSSLGNVIGNLCTYVLEKIKQHDGMKRGKVKDGIIIACIMYVGKSEGIIFDYNTMSKKLDVPMKFITRGEDVILELVRIKKINLDKWCLHKTPSPFQHVLNITSKLNLSIPSHIFDYTESTINNHSDSIKNHTPSAIGSACLFKALVDNGAKVDFKAFCSAFKISAPTMHKTLKALNIQIDN